MRLYQALQNVWFGSLDLSWDLILGEGSTAERFGENSAVCE